MERHVSDLLLTTFDWVPTMVRGVVRDLRLRWALEEAELPYRVESVPFRDRGAEHFAHQPFGQVPWLTDGDLSIFETGAVLLHLGGLSAKLMPTDARRRSESVEWMFAAPVCLEVRAEPGEEPLVEEDHGGIIRSTCIRGPPLATVATVSRE